MKNLIFDVNVILDLWLERQPEERLLALAGLLEARTENTHLCWIGSCSLHVLEYIARREFKKNGADPLEAKQVARELLAHLLNHAAPLTCFGFHQNENLIAHTDIEDAQIVRAASLLCGPSAIVTNEKRFDTGGTDVLQMMPSEAGAWLFDPTPSRQIDFIDLKTQQDLIRTNLEAGIHRVLHHGQYIMGPEVRKLEEKLANFTGSAHAITCASGTDALLIALMALDIGPGDEVVTVPYTWISTAEVIALLNAKPVFVDIRPDTFNMDPDLIQAAITDKTKAIMPVSIYGQCADMTRINAIAEKYGLPVIEDGAQSLGATHHGKKSCALSLIGCTSFFPSKPLGCYGDGGAVFTDDDGLAEKMRQIRVHGQKVKHQHPLVGINGRLDTVQAAVLLEKLAIFPEECRRRWEAGKRYDALLSGVSGIQTPVIGEGNDSVYAQYTLLAEDRDALSQRLKAAGIPSVAYYTTPLHLQGAFADLGHSRGDFPVSEDIADRCLSLPMSPYLSENHQKHIASAIKME